jgi:WD40 repeat protein
MEKKIFMIAAIILATGLILAGCLPDQVSVPEDTGAPEPSPTAAASATPAPSATPSPTPTMTPTPVSFQSAAGQNKLSEIEVFGKGRIQLQDFSPDGSMFAAVVARGIYVINPETWEEINFLPLSPGLKVQSITFSRDSSLFAAGDSDGNVTFRDTRTWEVTQVLKVHNGPVTGLDISPDNTKCVTIGDGREIALWDLSGGIKIKSQVRAKDAGPVHYSFDGSMIWVSEATTYSDLTVWNGADLNFIDRKPQMGRPQQNLAVSPYANILAAFSWGDIIVYDFDNKKETRFEDVLGRTLKMKMVFMDKTSLVVETTDNGEIHLADLNAKRWNSIPRKTVSGWEERNPELGLITKAEEIQALGFSSYSSIRSITTDGEALVLTDGLFDLHKKELRNVAVLNELDLSLSFVLTNGNLAIIDAGQQSFPNKVLKGSLAIITLDKQDYSQISRQRIEFDLSDGIQQAALSPDGSTLVAGLLDGSVHFWDTKSGKLLGSVRAHNKVYEVFGLYGSIKDIIFSRDGSLIATVGFDKTIKIWRTVDFSLVSSLYGRMAAFSPDSDSLAYVDSYNRIQVQSLQENTAPVFFDGHTQDVTGLLFSADGSMVVSGSRDETIKIWSIADQALQLELPQSYLISSMILSPDGTRLYSRTFDGVISVWGYAAP